MEPSTGNVFFFSEVATPSGVLSAPKAMQSPAQNLQRQFGLQMMQSGTGGWRRKTVGQPAWALSRPTPSSDDAGSCSGSDGANAPSVYAANGCWRPRRPVPGMQQCLSSLCSQFQTIPFRWLVLLQVRMKWRSWLLYKVS